MEQRSVLLKLCITLVRYWQHILNVFNHFFKFGSDWHRLKVGQKMLCFKKCQYSKFWMTMWAVNQNYEIATQMIRHIISITRQKIGDVSQTALKIWFLKLWWGNRIVDSRMNKFECLHASISAIYGQICFKFGLWYTCIAYLEKTQSSVL